MLGEKYVDALEIAMKKGGHNTQTVSYDNLATFSRVNNISMDDVMDYVNFCNEKIDEMSAKDVNFSGKNEKQPTCADFVREIVEIYGAPALFAALDEIEVPEGGEGDAPAATAEGDGEGKSGPDYLSDEFADKVAEKLAEKLSSPKEKEAAKEAVAEAADELEAEQGGESAPAATTEGEAKAEFAVNRAQVGKTRPTPKKQPTSLAQRQAKDKTYGDDEENPYEKTAEGEPEVEKAAEDLVDDKEKPAKSEVVDAESADELVDETKQEFKNEQPEGKEKTTEIDEDAEKEFDEAKKEQNFSYLDEYLDRTKDFTGVGTN